MTEPDGQTEEEMRIALAGNPNSGKTTMYNALTGKHERVGNWSGVTVDKNEHALRRSLAGDRSDVVVVDLPGAYSMSPFTSEESITNEYINSEHPDVIINIVDATNLSRSLFFTTQLLEIGIPVVVALNKTDLNERKENKIDVALLSDLLGCPVYETVSAASKGLLELSEAAINSVGKIPNPPYKERKFDTHDRAAAETEDRRRFSFVDGIVKRVEKRKTFTREKNIQDKIDDILTDKWLGIPIFALIMFLVFWISQSGPAVWLADLLTSGLEYMQNALEEALGTEGFWTSVLVDGVVGGFIAIVGFLPLIMVMFFLIALLEDCGYMARATVVLDPIFKRVGLSGKSVIPFIMGCGCSVPGIMASRTIRDERERRATAILTPFMPCGAKLPVISLFAGAFFSNSAWVGALMYFVGIILIFFVALLVNALTGNKARKSFFIIELPEYKLPGLLKALRSMVERGWSYVVKAGTVILVCNTAVHVMSNFDFALRIVENPKNSILATVAAPISYVIAPIIGVVAWQFAAAALAGFIAKENVVGTLAVSFSVANLFDLDSLTAIGGSEGAVATAFGISSAAALAFLMFNLFTPPCFAAIGAMSAEIKSKRWLFMGIGIQLAVGYTVAFLVYFFGTLFAGDALGPVWMPLLGWGIILLIGAIFTAMIIRNRSGKLGEKLCTVSANTNSESVK